MAAHSAAIISMPILLAAARVDHLLDQDRPDFTGHRNNAIQYLFTQLRMITGAEHGTDHLGLRCASKIAGDTRIHRGRPLIVTTAPFGGQTGKGRGPRSATSASAAISRAVSHLSARRATS